MKNIILTLGAVIAGLSLLSCSRSGYEPGPEDLEDCPDVYFDGGQSAEYAFDQTEDIELSFTVSRYDTSESFVIPLEISGPENIIQVTPLVFTMGEKSAKITVRVVSLLEIQKEYAFTISIPAPEYAPYYGLNETSVTFSVIREDYEKVNSGTFHSELLAMSSNKVSLEYSEILDKYRIVSPWGRNSGDIIFAWDGESEEVTFEEDDMFYIEQITDSMSGSVYAAYAQPEEAAYDPSDKTFTFNFWYAIPSAGEYAGFGYSEDTFTLDK